MARSSATPDPTPAPWDPSRHREDRRLQQTNRELKSRLNDAADIIQNLEQQLEASVSIASRRKPLAPWSFADKERSAKAPHECTPVIVWSYLHPGKRIDRDKVGGLNEFNPDIAEQRMQAQAVNARRLIQFTRQERMCRQLVVCLNGDIIENFLHPENHESNYLAPADEAVFTRDILNRALSTLLEDPKLQKIAVVCNVGNHGRTTLKMPAGQAWETSWEHLIYKWLAHDFRADARVRFDLGRDYAKLVRIHGAVLRVHHGDAVRYGGGVGGLSIPMNKYVYRMNQTEPAHLDVIGHFHQLGFYPLFYANGSLCGYDTYARRIGASHEQPQQAFFVVDSKRGLTTKRPILCQ